MGIGFLIQFQLVKYFAIIVCTLEIIFKLHVLKIKGSVLGKGLKNIYPLTMHDNYIPHIDVSLVLKCLLKSIPVLPLLIERKEHSVASNREIIRQLIDIVLLLGQHSMTFREHQEDWESGNHGNFKDLVVSGGS